MNLEIESETTPFTPWDALATDAERLERWLNVDRVLTALPPHERELHFNMHYWGYENDCGTIGCAAGLCSLDAWFASQGWRGKFVPLEQFDGVFYLGGVGDGAKTALRLDDGSETGAFMGGGVIDFFGPSEDEDNCSTERGRCAIFTNNEVRSVDTVIGEVRDRIAYLRNEYRLT